METETEKQGLRRGVSCIQLSLRRVLWEFSTYYQCLDDSHTLSISSRLSLSLAGCMCLVYACGRLFTVKGKCKSIMFRLMEHVQPFCKVTLTFYGHGCLLQFSM